MYGKVMTSYEAARGPMNSSHAALARAVALLTTIT
jgi:hypothetical protein